MKNIPRTIIACLLISTLVFIVAGCSDDDSSSGVNFDKDLIGYWFKWSETHGLISQDGYSRIALSRQCLQIHHQGLDILESAQFPGLHIFQRGAPVVSITLHPPQPQQVRAVIVMESIHDSC